jgi:hypothetical protein
VSHNSVTCGVDKTSNSGITRAASKSGLLSTQGFNMPRAPTTRVVIVAKENVLKSTRVAEKPGHRNPQYAVASN